MPFPFFFFFFFLFFFTESNISKTEPSLGKNITGTSHSIFHLHKKIIMAFHFLLSASLTFSYCLPQQRPLPFFSVSTIATISGNRLVTLATILSTQPTHTPIIPRYITKYWGMIGSFLYLIASRPTIMFSVCLCTCFQDCPKESHISSAIKCIFWYLYGTIDLGLYYLKWNEVEFD